MKSTKHPLLLGAALVAALSLTSCKKDNETRSPEDLPELGTCQAVTATGGLTFTSGRQPYSFTTSGGSHITVNPELSFEITNDAYPGFRLEFWGQVTVEGVKTFSANHENLNGKHIKDRFGDRRTIVFPDGAKITWITDGEQGRFISISIYDGKQFHHINGLCYTLESSIANESVARKMDDAEADGETATFEIGKLSSGEVEKLQYINIYRESTPGNRVNERVLLGEIFRNEPNRVNDYFDDPRLQAT